MVTKRKTKPTHRRNGNSFRFDPHNARKHGERNKAFIRQSLEEVGGGRSILVDGDGIVRAGNGVSEQAQALGMRIRPVRAKRNEIIAVVREDLHGAEAVRAALLDNRASDLSEWDAAVLREIEERDHAALAGMFENDEWKEILARNGMEGFDFSKLPNEDRPPFRQVTFTLHDSQFEQVEAAIKASMAMGAFVNSPNENGNGNALARICETFITEHGNS